MRLAIISLICVLSFGSEYIRFVTPKTYGSILLPKPLKEVRVGERALMKVLSIDTRKLLFYPKKEGSTSLFLRYEDGTFDIYTIHILPNIEDLTKIVHTLEPAIELSLTKKGILLIDGHYSSLLKRDHIKRILRKFGFDTNRTLDLAGMKNYRRMVRARLYAIEIDENRAKKLKTDLSLIHMGDSRNFFAHILSSGPTLAGNLLTGGYQKFTGRLQIDSLITFLQNKGLAHVIEDTMLTIKEENNGTIFIGGEIYVPSQISYDSGGRPTIGTTSKKYGLKLTITPKIKNDELIDMDIHLESSDFDPDPSHKVFIGSDLQGNPIYIPAFTTKEDSTSLLVHNKEIITLGGRLSRISSQYQEKVPLLGDIPLIGNLFKNSHKRYEQRDILFFIIPEVVTIQQTDTMNFKETLKRFPKKFSVDELFPRAPSHNPTAERNVTKSSMPKKNSTERTISLEHTSETNATTSTMDEQLYKVSVHRCFVRSLDDNSIVNVWKEGHPFVGRRIKHKKRVLIVKNCTKSQKCVELNNRVTISLKCVETY